MKIRWEKDLARWCAYSASGDYLGSITKEDRGWCASINGATRYADNFHDARCLAYDM